MATQLTFRRGTSEPTQASGLTLGEPAFNTALNTFHIGRGAGVTAAWIGAQISGLSTGIAAGLTLQVPTMSAVKDYVASTTSGVATLNSLTGTVTIAGGTNIGVTTAGSSITVTNLGVQTFNGLTGAVGGVTTSAANTFTALNTFNAGITTSSIYASTGSTFGGTLLVNGKATFNGVVDVVNGLTSAGSIQFSGTATKNIRSTQAPIVITGVTTGDLDGQGYNEVTIPANSSALSLTSATNSVNIVSTNTLSGIPGLRIVTNDYGVIGEYGTTIKPTSFAGGERTQTLQNASGVIALTSQLMGAINGSTAATTAVTSFNGLTGAVQGVSAAVAGTGISVSGATGAVTITNIGVQSFNGNTGAVTGASLGANTFTALNTFNAGISAAGGVTFAGDIAVNGGDITTTSATATVFNTTATTLSIGGAATSLTIGATSGGGGSAVSIRSGTITLGSSSSTFIQTIAGTTNDLYIQPNGNLVLAAYGSPSTGTTTTLAITNGIDAQGQVQINGGDFYLGTKSVDEAVYTPVNIIFEGSGNVDNNKTTLTVVNPTANRTITLPNDSGTVALTSQLMGAVNGSTAATNAVTSFNGSTGAVTGASLGANTFTGLNTFNAGVTTSFLYASTGSTFGGTLKVVGGATFDGRVDVAGILDVAGGVTFESTSDHGGAARFASTIVSTGSVTANGGLTASTLDVSGAARFASTVVSTGSITANGGLTASTLNVTGTAQTTGNMTVGATLTVTGNLIVNGTTTTINSTTLSVDDKNIVLADGNAVDAAADGGGITLKGLTDKTFNWVDGTDSWTSSEHMDLAASKVFKIGTSTVLSSNALGSGVTGSSLTAVGTLATGIWQATAIGATYGGTGLTSYTIGDVIYASGTSSLAKLGGVTAGYLLSANGTGTAPEYKQLLVKDGGGTSIATITSASGTLSAAIQYATASLKGVASFDNTNFTVSTGAVTITGVDGGTY